jgi:hypothetical protein
MNFHALLHVPMLLSWFGPLRNFWTKSHEARIRKTKKFVRTSNMHKLQQRLGMQDKIEEMLRLRLPNYKSCRPGYEIWKYEVHIPTSNRLELMCTLPYDNAVQYRANDIILWNKLMKSGDAVSFVTNEGLEYGVLSHFEITKKQGQVNGVAAVLFGPCVCNQPIEIAGQKSRIVEVTVPNRRIWVDVSRIDCRVGLHKIDGKMYLNFYSDMKALPII